MIYTVEGVERTREWASQKGGPMVSYYCTLRDQQGIVTRSVDVAQKASSPAVASGQQIEGDINMGEYGPKLKKAWTGGGGSGQESPERAAAIQRMASVKAAHQSLELAITLGIEQRPETPKALLDLIRKYADYWDTDVARKRAAA